MQNDSLTPPQFENIFDSHCPKKIVTTNPKYYLQ